VAVYTGNLAVITWLDAATWIYATGRSGLATGMTPRLTRVSRGLACVPAAGFTVAAGAAWLSTWAGLVIAVTLPLIPLTGSLAGCRWSFCAFLGRNVRFRRTVPALRPY
jgi:hypothetical protein